MAFKVTLAVCASALLVGMAMAQGGCGCNAGLGWAGNGLGLAGNGLGLAGSGLAGCGNTAYVGSGGGLGVTSYSPLAPSGISVLSENAIEGSLAVNGALPVLSAAAFEGQVPTAGQVGVQYSCGNGNVGITSQNAAGGISGAGWAGNAAGLGYGAGLANGLGGCGCTSY